MKTYSRTTTIEAARIESADATKVYTEDGESVEVGKDWMTYWLPQPGHYLVRDGSTTYVADNLDGYEELTPPKKAAKK